MTQNITKAIENEKDLYKISKLHSWKLTSENNLMIEADIQNESTIFKNLCAQIEIPPQYRNLPKTIFSKCKHALNAESIDAKLITQEDWNNADSIYMKLQIPVFAKNENQEDYYELTGIQKSTDIPNHSISKIYTDQKRIGLLPMYPIALSYDLLAGTIHTMGTPFGIICIIVFRDVATKGSTDSKSFQYYASLPFCGTYSVLSYLDILFLK
jgi:hypothetical protein